MVIFKIGSVDFSSNVVVPEYDINRLLDYDSYEDCNYVTHKIPKRRKVSGSFSLKFFSMDDFVEQDVVVHGYRTFVQTMLSSRKSDGSWDVTLYLNNELIEYTGNFDLDYKAKNNQPLYGIKDTDSIQVSVEER